ncbi:MAG: type VII toxin-antitoxin system MntA family adenylyltransferase antitoxin [Candidatus Rokuibacteriota bacterium]
MEARSLENIARTYGVVLLLQFGSTVSGREHPRSDVDLAVLFHGPCPSLLTLGELAGDFRPLYPGREVDLALIDRADPLFLKRITENCRLVYGSPRRLHELRMYAFRRYQDHRRYLALERFYVDRVLRTLASP